MEESFLEREGRGGRERREGKIDLLKRERKGEAIEGGKLSREKERENYEGRA